jgi:methionine synthase I (cobalamin-dependent)
MGGKDPRGMMLSIEAAKEAEEVATKVKARAKERARSKAKKKKKGPKLKTVAGKMGPTTEQGWWYGARNNETPRGIATKLKVCV